MVYRAEPEFGEEMSCLLKGLRQRLDREKVKMGEHDRLLSRRGRVVSQEELAEAVGISRGWYTSLERGAMRPSIGLLKRLADTLEATPDERVKLLLVAIPELRGFL